LPPRRHHLPVLTTLRIFGEQNHPRTLATSSHASPDCHPSSSNHSSSSIPCPPPP
jgi:hypothetical protein